MEIANKIANAAATTIARTTMLMQSLANAIVEGSSIGIFPNRQGRARQTGQTHFAISRSKTRASLAYPYPRRLSAASTSFMLPERKPCKSSVT